MYRIGIFFYLIINPALSQLLSNTVHKTSAAVEKINNLWCYTCHTMEDGETCIELTTNHSSLYKKCKPDEFICMVKRFSYTTSTENATSSPRMWSLERRCSTICEPDCIVIGERTKLYACTSCCETSYCNTGKGGGNNLSRTYSKEYSIFVFLIYIFINN